MPLDRQDIVQQFIGGMNEYEHAFNVQPNEFLNLENMRHYTPSSLGQRMGTTAYTANIIGSGTMSGALNLFTNGQRIGSMLGFQPYFYSSATSNWTPLGGTVDAYKMGQYLPSVRLDVVAEITMNPASSSSSALSAQLIHAGCAYNNGYIMIGGLTSTSSFSQCTVIDATTGSIIASVPAGGSSDISGRCRTTKMGNYLITVYDGADGADLQFYYFDTSSPSSGIVNVSSSSYKGKGTGVEIMGDPNNSGRLFLSAKISLFRINFPALTTVDSVLLDPDYYCMDYDGTKLVVSSDSSAAIKSYTITGTLTASTNSGSGGFESFACESSTAIRAIGGQSLVATGPVTGAIFPYKNLFAMTSAWRYGGHTFAGCRAGGTTDAETFALCAQFDTFAATANAQTRPIPVAGVLYPNQVVSQAHVGSIGTISSTQFVFCIVVQPDATNTASRFVAVVKATMNDPAANKMVSGRYESRSPIYGVIESVRAHEGSFAQRPKAPSDFTDTAGGNINGGTYTYCTVYTWRDSSGRLHRSQPSALYTASIGAARQGTIRCYILSATMKCSASNAGVTNPSPNGIITIDVYRTLQNGDATKAMYKIGQVVNNPAASNAYLTFTDNVSDTTAATGQLLYTLNSAALASWSVPSAISCVQTSQRTFYLDATARRIWYSNVFISGEAPIFNPLRTIEIPGENKATCLGILDDKVIVFTRNTIFILTGDGGSENGTGITYNLDVLPTDVGCIEPRSLIECPTGLFFQADSGIHILTRGMIVQYLGNKVRNTLASFPVITSATFVPRFKEVRFACKATETGTTGVVLVYQIDYDSWTTYKYRDSVNSVANCGINGSVYFNGDYYFISQGGGLHSESRTSWLDGGATWVTASVTTPWYSFGNSVGFNRAKSISLGYQYYAKSSLNVQRGYDYGSYGSAVNFTDTDLATTSQVGRIMVYLDVQKFTSVSFKLTFADPGASYTTGRAIELTGFKIPIGQKKGSGKLIVETRKKG